MIIKANSKKKKIVKLQGSLFPDELLPERDSNDRQRKRRGVFLKLDSIFHKRKSLPKKPSPKNTKERDRPTNLQTSKKKLGGNFFKFVKKHLVVISFSLNVLFVVQLVALFYLSHRVSQYVWPFFIIQNFFALFLTIFETSTHISRISDTLKIKKHVLGRMNLPLYKNLCIISA